jgi:hypothetical protein
MLGRCLWIPVSMLVTRKLPGSGPCESSVTMGLPSLFDPAEGLLRARGVVVGAWGVIGVGGLSTLAAGGACEA